MENIFPKRLKEAIDKKGINQSELAKRLGIRRETIWKYLTGKIEPSCAILRGLCFELGVSADYLLGLVD